jgi:hypothetical protein
MNSANLYKPMKRDSGMEGRKHYLALGSKTLAPGEGKEQFSRHANARDPEVQHSSVPARGSTEKKDRWSSAWYLRPLINGGHGLADG